MVRTPLNGKQPWPPYWVEFLQDEEDRVAAAVLAKAQALADQANVWPSLTPPEIVRPMGWVEPSAEFDGDSSVWDGDLPWA